MAKEYEKYARKYPAIVAMIIPAFLTTEIIWTYFPVIQERWFVYLARVGTFIPVALVYGAIGYFARELFRDASKTLFQYPMFREDETDMPTTKLLLRTHRNRLSSKSLDVIAAKIKNDFDIQLLNEEEERDDVDEAKKTIVDAVGKIREATRSNHNLLHYNIDFGFCRNYLGASVYAVIFIIVVLVINVLFNVASWRFTLLMLFIQLILSMLVFLTLKSKGYSYARALFNAYVANTSYKWEGK